MKNLRLLDQYRDREAELRFYGVSGDDTCGCFRLPSPIDRALLVIVASSDGQWDHVSVSRGNRCPNWPEMEHVKRLFFEPHEEAMQLHVPVSEHINAHPNCLHLWRPQKLPIPRPPGWMVALRPEYPADHPAPGDLGSVPL
jgi:hypothetical protein